MSGQKKNMSQMYEVLKFIEHGNQCRRSLDCVRGTLLLEFLKENPRLEKTLVFRWFRQLAGCADQYHRSGNNKSYKFLNPCGIVVSQGKELFLLDMESEENVFVMKMMQRRAMREHFVRPMYEQGMASGCRADLLAYGKTIQFILAYVQITPLLTKREEIRLAGLIAKCTDETKRKYSDFREVIHDLPLPVSRTETKKRRIYRGKAILFTAVLLSAFLGMHAEKIYLNTRMTVIEKAEAAIIAEDALAAYDRLIHIEKSRSKVEEACINKMNLLVQMGRVEEAVETGETVLLEIQESETISEAVREYSVLSGENP